MAMDPSSTESFARAFLALGPPILLLAGIVATATGAGLARGGRRWWILALGPLATLALAILATWFVATVLQPGEGSGFLLGAAAFALFILALAPYYMVLLVVWLRHTPRTRPNPTHSPHPDARP